LNKGTFSIAIHKKMSNRIVSELERIIEDMKVQLNARDARIAELERIISPPEYTSPERDAVIACLSHPSIDLLDVAGEISDDIIFAFHRTDMEHTARTLIRLIINTNMCDELGISLKTCFGERAPSYKAWLVWKSVGYN
jgi:hypothetical protein